MAEYLPLRPGEINPAAGILQLLQHGCITHFLERGYNDLFFKNFEKEFKENSSRANLTLKTFKYACFYECGHELSCIPLFSPLISYLLRAIFHSSRIRKPHHISSISIYYLVPSHKDVIWMLTHSDYFLQKPVSERSP